MGKCKLLALSNSVISSSLAIRFTDDVVILRNRATDAPCASQLPSPSRLSWHGPNLLLSLPHVKFYVFFISLCTNVPKYLKTDPLFFWPISCRLLHKKATFLFSPLILAFIGNRYLQNLTKLSFISCISCSLFCLT